MAKKTIISLSAVCAAWIATAQVPAIGDEQVRANMEFAEKQLCYALAEIDATHVMQGTTPGQRPTPRTVKPDGSLSLVRSSDWTSGFFAGTLWYMYEQTGDIFWKDEAVRYTDYLGKEQYNTSTHDLGFMMYCSFGNGLRLADVPGYKEVLIQSSKSLIGRFNPKTGVIRSWDHGEWDYPVIIDNMMNLEMLFWASRATGDDTYYKIAVTHADNTLKHHFRSDHSSYHVVDYDVKGDGLPRLKQTHQGYSHESAWARGQAWGLYGFTMCYRETGDPRYLEQAEYIAGFILDNLPEDFVPYWDYNAPDIPDAPRDVSAAAITASALYELSTMSSMQGERYRKAADKMIASVMEKYRAPLGGARGFLTTSSTGHLPGNSEIDTPLNYADYYFVEALVRKERLAQNKPVVPAVK
ncbi:glycoside hydrolase family 88 protein [uncultured Alistipes sp.]|jgi:hypothetical protein|uniref:glycoside hydrolase family 88 protein n=1 Tax=uncultured Alistipes sp. TaxID=538949 RepID=UPI0025F1A8B6|nr:glycoside hydrolase family 88 protein [uncultured Alistipes sp.]